MSDFVNMNRVDFFIREDFMRDGFDLWVVARANRLATDDTSVTHVGRPVTMAPRQDEDSGGGAEPTIRLGRVAAMSLMEQLWRLGIRPREYGDAPGELRATKYHLEDMRRLAMGGADE